MTKACNKYEEIVIVGDFNCPSIDCKLLTANKSNEKILNIVNDMYSTQHVTEATRKDNILDLVLTSQPHIVENVSIEAPFSDHNIVISI